jgi:hypothetical protein
VQYGLMVHFDAVLILLTCPMFVLGGGILSDTKTVAIPETVSSLRGFPGTLAPAPPSISALGLFQFDRYYPWRWRPKGATTVRPIF